MRESEYRACDISEGSGRFTERTDVIVGQVGDVSSR